MVMIAKKKQTRLKPLSPTVKKRLKERGEPIGRTVKRPPKKRDRMGPKILRLEAPLPGKPRTKKRPKPKIKGLGSLVGGAAGSVLKKAAGALGKKDLDKLKELFKDQKGNIKPRKFRKPIGKMPPSEIRKRRVGFMKK